jgi:hypothetical protein
MEGQAETKTQTLVDSVGKPFIQAEDLTARIAATIDACAADYAIGYAAVFGALEQLKAQYLARVALKVQQNEPGEVLAIGRNVANLEQAIAAQQAEALAATQKAQRTASRAPSKAPRGPNKGLKSVK